jgi:hypothetical protein
MKEFDCWKKINNAQQVFIKPLNGIGSLCMPLAIHAQTINNVVFFDFDLNKWFLQDNVIAGELPESMRLLSLQMDEMAIRLGYKDARLVAASACEKAATQMVMHSDLEWRHVALLPVFDSDGIFSDLNPILIDFDHVEDPIDYVTALTTMQQRLKELSNQPGLRFE